MVISSVRRAMVSLWDRRPPSALEQSLGLSSEELRSFRRSSREDTRSDQEVEALVNQKLETLRRNYNPFESGIRLDEDMVRRVFRKLAQE